MAANRQEAAAAAREVLEAELDSGAGAETRPAPAIYFAGRNNGVAEELTLKTNEITHKKSDFLEGTYAVHGIEEIMKPDEVVLVIDPFPAEVGEVQEHAGRRRRHDGDRRGGARDDVSDDPHSAGGRLFRPCCNSWPAGTSWSRSASPWGSISTRPQRARKIGNEFIGRKKIPAPQRATAFGRR